MRRGGKRLVGRVWQVHPLFCKLSLYSILHPHKLCRIRCTHTHTHAHAHTHTHSQELSCSFPPPPCPFSLCLPKLDSCTVKLSRQLFANNATCPISLVRLLFLIRRSGNSHVYKLYLWQRKLHTDGYMQHVVRVQYWLAMQDSGLPTSWLQTL